MRVKRRIGMAIAAAAVLAGLIVLLIANERSGNEAIEQGDSGTMEPNATTTASEEQPAADQTPVQTPQAEEALDGEPPDFSGIALSAAEVPQYGKLELTFDLTGEYDNPFNPDEVDVRAYIVRPDGIEETVPGFYKSNESPSWAVRYSPRTSGEHTLRLAVTDRFGDGQSADYAFLAVEAEDNRGFIKAQGSRFVDSYGKQFTLLGTNYAWGRTTEILEAMPLYKEAKMNLMRVWYSCWWANYAPEYGPLTTVQAGIEMEYEGIGKYQLENQTRMDTLMETAEENDIYIMFTLNSFGDFWYDWEYHAYNEANGGPSYWTENNTDFWTNPEAISYQKKLLRYVFARWGYSRSLGMLEYWNESDNRVDTDEDTRRAWHNKVDEYWKSMDFYGRPTTTSFAWRDHGEFHKVTWEKLETMDAVNIHYYLPDDNAAEVWERELRRMLKQYGNRPVFVGEFGKTHSDISVDPLLPNYYHDAVWTPIFRAGAAGANMVWIMDQGHLDQSGFHLPAEYKAIYTRMADFIQPEEEHLIHMEHVDFGMEADSTKIGGYKNGERALLWMNDTLSPFKVDPRTIDEGLSFVLPDMAEGMYDIRYYNTYTGEYIAERVGETKDGSLTLSDIPSFQRDIAIKIAKRY